MRRGKRRDVRLARTVQPLLVWLNRHLLRHAARDGGGCPCAAGSSAALEAALPHLRPMDFLAHPPAAAHARASSPAAKAAAAVRAHAASGGSFVGVAALVARPAAVAAALLKPTALCAPSVERVAALAAVAALPPVSKSTRLQPAAYGAAAAALFADIGDGGRSDAAASAAESVAAVGALLRHRCAHRACGCCPSPSAAAAGVNAGVVSDASVGASLGASLGAWYGARLPSRRGRAHEAAHLPQEAALAELAAFAWRQSAPCSSSSASTPPTPPRCVVDVGGGNGILAFLLSQRLACDAVVVDPCVPPLRVDTAEAAGDPHFRRVVAGVGAGGVLSGLRQPAAGLLLVTKHLCGAALDDLLRALERDAVWPRAMVLSSCCHHKSPGAHAYVNAPYLRSALSVAAQEDWDAVTRKTSWLAGRSQPWMVTVAEALECALDHGRVLWLRERGYRCAAVEFVSPLVTPRNTALVAWRTPEWLLGP